MLHHFSFNARNPHLAASVLADMLGVQAVAAPTPPFPTGAWFVVFGDMQGSLIEVLPWGKTLDPDTRGMCDDLGMRSRSGSHLLTRTTRSAADVLTIARAHDWRASPASAGLFDFTKVWVENTFLIEIMTTDQARDYVRAFGSPGIATLDARLRALEIQVSGAGPGRA
jgi:hypothetical protein